MILWGGYEADIFEADISEADILLSVVETAKEQFAEHLFLQLIVEVFHLS